MWIIINDADPYINKNNKKQKKVNVICSGCNKEAIRYISDLNRRNVGCLSCNHSKITHGMSGTQFYRSWQAMIQRTRRDKYYKESSVYEPWLMFDNFYTDMYDSWFEHAQLSRYNDTGDYIPGNCRWLTKSQNLKEMNISRDEKGRFKCKN